MAAGVKWMPGCGQPPGRSSSFLQANKKQIIHPTSCLTVGHTHRSLLDFCTASLFRTMSFEVLSESASHQQSLRSNGSFDLDPLGVDQSCI